MSKKKLAAIIAACIVVVVVVIVIVVRMQTPTPEPAYDLTIVSTAGGSVTTPGEGIRTYDAGSVVNLVAEADAGYEFVGWTGGAGTIADDQAATTTITMDADCSITANFESIPPVQYNLTVASTAGGLVTTPGVGTFSYDAGSVVNLVAEADEGYEFVEWTGGAGIIADDQAATTTITMDADCSITANFESIPPVQYNLTISSTAGGLVISPGEGMFPCSPGMIVGLVAEPAPGYRFVNWTGNVDTINNVNSASTTITMSADRSITANFYRYTPMVAAGGHHTVGLKANGTVVAVGQNNEGQCGVSTWTDIVAIAAGESHTVGLRANGTVVAVGRNAEGQLEVSGWTGIIQVAAGGHQTVGLKSDGTVVAVGDNAGGSAVSGVATWSDIIQVAAGAFHTVGLKSDGTVVAVGSVIYGQCFVVGWSDIVQVAAGGSHTVGLKANGTVLAVGRNDEGQLEVSGWTGLAKVAAGRYHTVGLRANGTVVAVGNNLYWQLDVSGWTNIVQIAAGDWHTVGLRANGTVVAEGMNDYGQCEVIGWNLGD